MNITSKTDTFSDEMINNKQQKIVIVGQGAIGLLCYHHLQQAKHSVTLLSSKTNLKANFTAKAKPSYLSPDSNQSMYLYTHYQAKEAIKYPLIYAKAKDIKQADIIIFCVKAYQVLNALKLTAEFIKPSCLLLLSHNGMGTLTEVESLLPYKQRVLAMLTTHGCLRNSPLNITHTGLGQSDLGLLTGSMTASEKNALTALLNKALPCFIFEPNIKRKQWIKLAINCVINPLTAIYDIENGQVNLTKFTELKAQLISEVVTIAKVEGVDFTKNELIKTINDVAEKTEKNSSSMRCDVLSKRQTEINYINGYIHCLGLKHGIATPENTKMWHAINEIKKQY